MTNMVWKGVELVTIRDLMDHGIDTCETPEEARAFMAQYRGISPHAATNIGYLSGYYGVEERRRIQEWFQVAHPIFGTYEPTAEEAFNAGQMMARSRDNVEGIP